MNATGVADQIVEYFANPQQAIRRLGVLQDAAGLLKVCRHFFPKEFAARNCVEMAVANSFHEALIGCLELVSRNLFEIPDGFFDDMTDEDLPLSYIPIEPLFPEWWSDDFDDLIALWQVLLILIGAAEADDSENEALSATNRARHQWQDKIIDCRKLARLCRRTDPPLCWLNLALLTLDHSTGNPWLDASYECPITDYDWTIRNVCHLQKKWREAGRACDQIMTLNAWLSEDALRIHQILALWEQALVTRQKDQAQ
jgi:hypothetical protein